MDRDTALQLLKSSSPHERLKAARFLAKHADLGDAVTIRQILKAEPVSWVRTALANALDKVSGPVGSGQPSAEGSPDVSAAAAREMRAAAVEEVTGTILHEFQPIIGLLKLRAQEEVANFDESGVKAQLERLELLITGIENLKKAAATPRRLPIDLGALVREIVARETDGHAVDVSCIGPEPLITESDQGLLALAISNGLRNAIEAVAGVEGPDADHSVIVTWGTTDIEVWLAIIDKGPGLSGAPQGAFNVGTTTKKCHTGFGLPIARQAMESLEGTASLSSAPDAGARFEIRWYR